jgi:hypothetical protein
MRNPQPFIQYGWDTFNEDVGAGALSIKIISLPIAYINTYSIQLTYKNPATLTNYLYTQNGPLEYPVGSGNFFSTSSNSFVAIGETGGEFYWTTFGAIQNYYIVPPS